MVIAQLEEEQQEAEKQSDQPESVVTAKTAEVKAEEPMVDPLQILLASEPAPLGSTIAVRLPPKETENISGDCDPDEKDDVQLTSADVRDNMGDI